VIRTTAALVMFVLLGALVASLPAHAADRLLEVVVWTEAEPVDVPESALPAEPEAIRNALMEQSRLLLSGMIYGYRFVYTPSDRARGVADRFELTPVGEVIWGDPRLSVVWIRRQGPRLTARVAYDLADFQAARRDAWSTNVLPTATGRGEGTMFGPGAKQGSLTRAIEQAIREYSRGRIDNKPRELAGDVLLWEPPYVVIGPATYITTAKIKLRIDTTVPYRVF
jgi:hypothetical protein